METSGSLCPYSTPDSEGRNTTVDKTNIRVVEVQLAWQVYRPFRGDRVLNPPGSWPGRWSEGWRHVGNKTCDVTWPKVETCSWTAVVHSKTSKTEKKRLGFGVGNAASDAVKTSHCGSTVDHMDNREEGRAGAGVAAVSPHPVGPHLGNWGSADWEWISSQYFITWS